MLPVPQNNLPALTPNTVSLPRYLHSVYIRFSYSVYGFMLLPALTFENRTRTLGGVLANPKDAVLNSRSEPQWLWWFFSPMYWLVVLSPFWVVYSQL